MKTHSSHWHTYTPTLTCSDTHTHQQEFTLMHQNTLEKVIQCNQLKSNNILENSFKMRKKKWKREVGQRWAVTNIQDPNFWGKDTKAFAPHSYLKLVGHRKTSISIPEHLKRGILVLRLVPQELLGCTAASDCWLDSSTIFYVPRLIIDFFNSQTSFRYKRVTPFDETATNQSFLQLAVARHTSLQLFTLTTKKTTTTTNTEMTPSTLTSS